MTPNASVPGRQALFVVAVVLATGLAGCNLGGGGGTPTGPATVTGLDVDCSSVENLERPPAMDRLQARQGKGITFLSLERPMPEGHALYVKKAGGEPIPPFDPRKAGASPRASIHSNETIVVVERRADGTCGRWEGDAGKLPRYG